MIAGRAQGPPAAAADEGPGGTALPPDGNVLPFLFLSPLRVAPEPTVQPPAIGAEPVAVTDAAIDTVQAQAATLVDRLALRRSAAVDPLFATAHKVMDLLRPTPTGRLDPICQATPSPVPAQATDTGMPASIVNTVMTATNAVAEAGPSMLAALMKNLTPADPNADSAPPAADAPAYVPLVQRTDGAVSTTPAVSQDLRQLIDSLPKPIAIDTPTRDLKDSVIRTTDAPSAVLFVDGAALRPHVAGAAADPSQSLKLDVPMRSPEWGQALGEKITWLVNQKLSSAEIRLNPPQLGPIEVRIAVSGDSTQIAVVAHNPITRDSLEAAVPQLRAALSGHGLGNVSVDISQRSFSDRQMAHARPDGWEPWQALTNEARLTGAPGARWHVPGRLDAYA
ncbi:MAG: flagellar hook-length control protein FliK [Steroidobacteraceae bacterium]